MVYEGVCINTLLYGSEAWINYRCHLKTLKKFHQYCHRKILCIRWKDCRTNASILMEANTASIEPLVMQNQLRWAGHCIKTSDNCLPRQVHFAQLTHGVRIRGGRVKRVKDTAKYYMKKGHININAWGLIVADRPVWCHSIY